MKRIVLPASIMAISMGCTHAPATVQVESAAAQTQVEQDRVAIALPASAENEKKTPSISLREPGDFVVYRLSGTYRKEPITLTHRVLEKDGDATMMDMTIDEGAKQERMRLRIVAGEVVAAARLEGKVMVPFGVAAYEKRMAELVPAADENEGLIESSNDTLEVHGHKVACTRATYVVRVGIHQALMTTLASADFGWGHLGGEIMTSDGKTLYKAEVVDLGNAPIDGWIAQHDDEIYDDDYEHFEE
jgi:hypothetical protein